MTSNRRRTNKTDGVVILFVTIVFANCVWAADVATVPFRIVQEMGLEAQDPLSLPTDVAVADNGNLYVVDSGNHRVVIFDSSGRRIGQLGQQGSDDGQLQDPVGIDIAANGGIYVADRGNSRIAKFFSDGSPPISIPLQENGKDVVPIDVAVSPLADELFVTSNNSHRVLVFSSTGELLRSWGGEGADPGQFRYPATLTLAGDAVFVVDVLNARVQRFDVAGGSNKEFGKLGAGPGTFFRPKGIAVDASGRVYVTDSYLGVIQVFSSDGEFLHAVGDDGVPTRFDNPVGLTTLGEQIVLVQMLPHTILIIEPEPGT
ncbi:MAG: hypothetical protein GXP15_11165 [Gammaproteobacteria bacterium]|nr:hypothetical protein [Gammaproteobacteria bacterium]